MTNISIPYVFVILFGFYISVTDRILIIWSYFIYFIVAYNLMYMNVYTYYITDWVTMLKINLNFPFSFSQKVSFIEDLIELLFHSYIVDIYKYAFFTSHKSKFLSL